MKKPLIIFGTGKIGEVAAWFFDRDSEYEIIAFVVDPEFIKEKEFHGRPVVASQEALTRYPPSDYSMFVALGYQGMNGLRTKKFEFFREKGYSFAKYVSPDIKVPLTIGENSIVMDGVLLQPHVRLHNNVFVWGGAMIGHHTEVEDNCWLTGSCAVGGSVHLGKSSFVGLGAIVGHEVIIGDKCMLGAGTVMCRNLPANAVLVAPNTEPHRLNSEQFTRMSVCFRV